MAGSAVPSSLRLLIVTAALVGLSVLSACSRTIGDACASNVECSPLGDRFCDLASPGGYCTVEGCAFDSCPDSAACVRFFSLKKGQARCAVGKAPRSDCDKASTLDKESCCVPGSADCCAIGEQCLCDSEECGLQSSQRQEQLAGMMTPSVAAPLGYCASETSERRWCMKGCDDDGDCRDGYACIGTGTAGSTPVPRRNDQGKIEQPALRYCAPRR
jgi:hypothetical protein